MARNLSRIIILSLMLFSGIFGLQWYDRHSTDGKLREKDEIISAERQKNEVLRGVLKRLQTDTRLARVIVTDQQTRNGQIETTVAFSEYDAAGKTLLDNTYRTFTVDGTTVYIAAYVVEFDDEKVTQDDPLRGHSIALFQRIFGEKGSVAGYELRSASTDSSSKPGVSPARAAMEKEVWSDFWKLSDDANLRKQYNVKNATGKAVFKEQFKPGYIYTITLDPRGNLGMQTEAMDPLILKQLQEKKASPATQKN